MQNYHAAPVSAFHRQISRVRDLERQRRGWEGISINEERELNQLRALLAARWSAAAAGNGERQAKGTESGGQGGLSS